MSEKLLSVKPGEIQIGKPLIWTVYDIVGRVLLREGTMVESQQQIDEVAGKGLFREDKVDARGKVREEAKRKSVEQIEDLQAIKMAIGDTVQMQDFSSDKQRFFVKLIGFMNRRSVLVSHPRQEDKLSYIKEGQGFLVRGFSGTKTYEFSSSVISVCLTPYPYLHLSFPPQVKTTNMRGAVRIKLRLPCSIESQATSVKVSAIIEDMSISGARIHAASAFGKVGDAVSVGLRMQVGGESQVFLVSAVIRNVSREKDSLTGSEITMHGMEFVQSVSVDLTVLQNYIYKSMLEG